MKLHIKDKEMPNNCGNCEYLTEACGDRFCRVDGLTDSFFFKRGNKLTKRHKDCPLRPISEILDDIRGTCESISDFQDDATDYYCSKCGRVHEYDCIYCPGYGRKFEVVEK